MGLSEPINFSFEGVDYQVSKLTQEVQDAFTLWCEAESWKCLRHSRNSLNDQEYNYLLSEHHANKKFGGFELKPQVNEAAKYMSTDDGYIHFMFLCFRKYNGITKEQLTEMINKGPAEDWLALHTEILSSKKNSTEQ